MILVFGFRTSTRRTRWPVGLVAALAVTMLGGCVRTREGGSKVPERIGRAAITPPAPIIVERSPMAAAPQRTVDGASQGERLPDEDVALAARQRLSELAGGVGRATAPVEISVQRGIVKLLGPVPTLYHGRVAVEGVLAVRGVRAVIDRLVLARWLVEDGEIETAVLRELVRDRAVEAFELSVSSRLGRVALDGVVDSPTEKQMAEERASSVRGVIEIWNRLRVVDRARRRDEDIRGDVHARLEGDPYLSHRGYRIAVSVDAGAVILTGTVASSDASRHAANLSRVRGAARVENGLQVDARLKDTRLRDAPPDLGDLQISEALREALDLAAGVGSDSVRVRVQAGRVLLTGTVPSRSSFRTAGRIAADTAGVKSVENAIEVRSPGPGTDAALAAELRRRLTGQADVDLDGVSISAKSGRVVLAGSVRSRLESLRLEELVSAVSGVVTVVNELRIADPLADVRDDAMIERDIETALWWDPRVNREAIDVEVKNGVVVLRGWVRDEVAHSAVLEQVRSARPRGIDDKLQRSAR